MENNMLGLFSWIAPNLIPLALFLIVLKFLTKRLPCKPLDCFFMKIHIPLGWILLVCTMYHTAATLLAGQTLTMQGGDIYKIPTLVFVSGLIATSGIIIAVASFIFRKKLNGKWLLWHRTSAVVAIAASVWHLAVWFGQKG